MGPEFGASVGIVFAFANAVAASMNTIGFCDSLNDLLRENGLKIIDNAVNDVRIVGVVAILVMILICAIGMEWESKVSKPIIFLIGYIFGALRGISIFKCRINLKLIQIFFGIFIPNRVAGVQKLWDFFNAQM